MIAAEESIFCSGSNVVRRFGSVIAPAPAAIAIGATIIVLLLTAVT